MSLQFLNNAGNLKDAVFCFTGKAPVWHRREMETFAINAGASVTKSVTDKTTILVIADANSTSSKANKARAAGIDLISPSQFLEMCYSTTSFNSGNKISQFKITKPKPSGPRRHSSIRRIQI